MHPISSKDLAKIRRDTGESLRNFIYLPVNELEEIIVNVDGKRWALNPKLWSACYDPNLGNWPVSKDFPAFPLVSARLSHDGHILKLIMNSGYDYHRYRVVWNLSDQGVSYRTDDDYFDMYYDLG